MSYLLRKATLVDLPTLLEFEQGVIHYERPMDPTIKSGNIHYYHIPDFIEGQAFASYGFSIVNSEQHNGSNRKLINVVPVLFYSDILMFGICLTKFIAPCSCCMQFFKEQGVCTRIVESRGSKDVNANS